MGVLLVGEMGTRLEHRGECALEKGGGRERGGWKGRWAVVDGRETGKESKGRDAKWLVAKGNRGNETRSFHILKPRDLR